MRRQQARIVITACNETRETVESAIRNLGGLATRVTAAAVKFSVLEYTARRAFDAASSAVKGGVQAGGGVQDDDHQGGGDDILDAGGGGTAGARR